MLVFFLMMHGLFFIFWQWQKCSPSWIIFKRSKSECKRNTANYPRVAAPPKKKPLQPLLTDSNIHRSVCGGKGVSIGKSKWCVCIAVCNVVGGVWFTLDKTIFFHCHPCWFGCRSWKLLPLNINKSDYMFNWSLLSVLGVKGKTEWCVSSGNFQFRKRSN